MKVYDRMFRYVSDGKTVRIMVAMPYFMVLDTISFEILQLYGQKVDTSKIVADVKKKYGWSEDNVRKAIESIQDVTTRLASISLY